MRDSLSKCRRKAKSKSGDGAITVEEYKYAKVLAFLVPFLADRPIVGNLESIDSDDEKSQPQENFSERNAKDVNDKNLSESLATKSEHSDMLISSQSKITEDTSFANTYRILKHRYCDYQKTKTRSPVKVKEKPDDIALFLNSMAGSIRKLPARQQAKVKFEIHSLVHKAEIILDRNIISFIWY